jgi:uncharacterized protein
MLPLLVNLRHLEHKNVSLEGELTAEEMELDTLDPLIQTPRPLAYALEVERLDDNLLVKGRLRMVLACECARCLRSYDHPVAIEDWTCLIPLTGEEAASVVNDCVDLTPYVREDTLLAFPLHPLCGSTCGGLSYPPSNATPGAAGETLPASSAWAELNKLKL